MTTMPKPKKGSIANRWNETPKQIKSSPNKPPTKAEQERMEKIRKKLKKQGKI